MKITEQLENEVTVFALEGRLDSNTSPEFETRLLGSISSGARKVVVDFASLDYISSAGMRVILKGTKELKNASGAIILCAMKDYVKEVFEIAGFDSFITIVPSLNEAKSKI